MRKKLFIILTLHILFILASSPVTAQIIGPEVKIQENDIIVNTGLVNSAEIEAMIHSGVEKEILFTIELFRVWSFWPDEFVVTKKIQQIIKYDNLRGQYRASSYDGTFLKEKRFNDFNTLKEWVFIVKDVNLANIKELEQGKYFIRVVVESRSRELPPVIGFFLMFIPEKEMSMAKESQDFAVGGTR